MFRQRTVETSWKFQWGSSQPSETISIAGIHVASLMKCFPIKEKSDETEDIQY